jgi:uncharacterized DUF497 family protein
MLEWDEAKRLKNIKRRGLDFEDADLMFDGRPVTAAARRNNEDRFVSTAEIDGKLYTVVWRLGCAFSYHARSRPWRAGE